MTIWTDIVDCYATYRPAYPQRLVDDLRERTIGDGGEILVDWGPAAAS